MKKSVENLMRELLALYSKFGASNFRAAINELRQGRISEDLIDISLELDMAVQQSKVARVSPLQRSKTSPSEALTLFETELRRSEGPLEKDIADFIKSIASRKVLATPRSLRNYITALGMNSTSTKLERYSVTKKIAHYLLELPHKEVIEKIRMADNFDSKPSTLQGWSNIIVKRTDD